MGKASLIKDSLDIEVATQQISPQSIPVHSDCTKSFGKDSNKIMFDKLGLNLKESELKIGEMNYRDDNFQVVIIRDDNPQIRNIYNLWYKIYIEEKGYPINERVDLKDKLYAEPQSGQVVAALKNKSEIVGSVRFSDDRHNKLEFNYHKYLEPNKSIQEISKYMVMKNYRNRVLSTFLLKICNDYLKGKLPADYYGINSAVNMLNYYSRLGFSRLSDEIVHPVIGNISYLLVAEKKKLDEVLNKIWDTIYSSI